MTRPSIGRAKDSSPRWLKDAANATTRAWGMATSRWRPGPDFLIVGTKRGGTTSLWNNLLQHPRVLGLFPEVRGRKSSDYFFRAGGQSPAWYRSHFPSSRQRERHGDHGARAMSGEASPYYMYSPHAAALIRAEYPDVRLIVLLRDPVERAYSHYKERTKEGVETLSFEEALASEKKRLRPDHERWLKDASYYSEAHDFFSYRDRGIYLPQIKRLLSHFPADQVHIQRSEDFYEDYQSAFDRVTGFLNIPPQDLHQVQHHNKIPRADMNPETREELVEFYRPHNAGLEDYLGRTFGWNS